MRYFKIPLCWNFVENVRDRQIKLRTNVWPTDTCQRQFGSKIGVWQIYI